jgi:hypothetical protein
MNIRRDPNVVSYSVTNGAGRPDLQRDWITDDVREALRFRLLEDLAQAQGLLRECAAAGCGKLLVRYYRREFCSAACRNRISGARKRGASSESRRARRSLPRARSRDAQRQKHAAHPRNDTHRSGPKELPLGSLPRLGNIQLSLDPAQPSLSTFNSEAAAAGIRGIVWAVGTPGIVLLLVIQSRRICTAAVQMYEYKTRPHWRP